MSTCPTCEARFNPVCSDSWHRIQPPDPFSEILIITTDGIEIEIRHKLFNGYPNFRAVFAGDVRCHEPVEDEGSTAIMPGWHGTRFDAIGCARNRLHGG